MLDSLFKKALVKKTPAEVFSSKFCEIFNHNSFPEHPQWLLLLSLRFMVVSHSECQILLFLELIISIHIHRHPPSGHSDIVTILE